MDELGRDDDGQGDFDWLFVRKAVGIAARFTRPTDFVEKTNLRSQGDLSFKDK
jgi:hypothetical protein